jgi:uncharacterized membrane protein
MCRDCVVCAVARICGVRVLVSGIVLVVWNKNGEVYGLVSVWDNSIFFFCTNDFFCIFHCKLCFDLCLGSLCAFSCF